MSLSESMQVPPLRQVQFSLTAQDPDATVAVVDSALATVAQATGHLTGLLPEGIYKARATRGQQLKEQYLILKEEQGTASVVFPRFVLSSPAPLRGAWKSSEYHGRAAERESRTYHRSFGRGSEIFVFVRDLGPPRRTVRSGQRSIAAGLSLHDAQGKQLTGFAGVGAEGLGEGASGPFFACNATVNPGVYYLHLRTDKDVLVRSLFVPNGWQLQVFLLQPSANPQETQYPNLVNATAFLVPVGSGFDAHSPLLQQSELALRILADHQPVSDFTAFSWAFGDPSLMKSSRVSPMLAIYDGHRLLRRGNRNREQLARIIRELRDVLGVHPDVEALALAAGEPEVALEAFTLPPLLLASWTLIVDQSLDRPELIKPGSLPAQLATRLWGTGPWLVWMDPEQPKSPTRSTRGSTAEDAARLRNLEPTALTELSNFEQALLDQLHPRPLHPLVERLARQQPLAFSLPTAATTEQLARKLRLPPAAVDELVADLLQRSGDQPPTRPDRKR